MRTSYFSDCKNLADVKKRYKHQYIGVDSSTAQFPRPLIYPETARHPILTIPGRNGKKVKSSIYGCSTYSRDYFVKEIKLSKIKIGDLIILSNAGSYCSSMFTEFLGFDKPKEIFL